MSEYIELMNCDQCGNLILDQVPVIIGGKKEYLYFCSKECEILLRIKQPGLFK